MGCKIDKNLLTMQGVMAYVSQIDTADDEILNDQATRAKWFAGIGTAGPAIIAGTMLMMYRIAIALFIGFGPLFILSLLFKKTAPLFQKWIYYGLATIFSSVMLAVMADISADLVENVAGTLFVAKGVISLTDTETSMSGIMQVATQQLGLGLILSTLLITVPPMAGMFFNGVMGSFTPFSGIAGWNNPAPPSSSVPPHMGGNTNSTVNNNTQTVKEDHSTRDSKSSPPPVNGTRHSDFGSTAGVKSTDTYTSGVMSPANNAVASKTTTGGVTDSPKTKPQEDQHV